MKYFEKEILYNRRMHDRRMIKALIFWLIVVLAILTVPACDFQENAVVREQADIFTAELREKREDMRDLANQLEVANERINVLEAQLLCREELIDEAVEQAKRDTLKENPVIITVQQKPQKSNKTEQAREEAKK